MENIIAAEILCTKLQESERPLEIGIGMALRVVLDENIALEEMRANANEHYRTTLKALADSTKVRVELLRENTQLKKLNAELEVKLETANKLSVLNTNRVKVIDTISKGLFLTNPVQNTIYFEGLSVEDKSNSYYYQAGIKRAKRIWNVVDAKQKISVNDFKLTSSHIVNWSTTFNVCWEEPLKYEHIKAACIPKCYGGLGTIVGMRLHDLLFKK